MSEADDVVDSISEAPMSGDEKDTALKAEWEQVCIENGVDPVTHCLPDGRKVNVGYLVLCKKLGHPHPSFEPTVVVPDEVLPAVDPGAFCKPRTPDKPRGATTMFGQFEMPPRPDLGAYMKAVTPTNLPPGVQQIADDFSWEGPKDRDKPHPIQLAREMKAASEPRPSGNERNTGGYTAATYATMAKAKAARPGFRFSQRNAPPGQVSWNDDWDCHVNSLITTQLAAFEGSMQKQQVRETRLAYQTELEKSRVAALVVDQFQRLAEVRALRDANDERDREVARELQLTEERLETVRFQQRLFASMCFFVAFLVVMYVGWWVQ